MHADEFDDAEDFYRQLRWGKRATKRLRVLAPSGTPDRIVCIGRFVDLELAHGRRWPDASRGERLTDTVWLATDENGRTLYFCARGGFKPGPGTPIGRIAAISYVSDKNDGDHVYRHEFGEGPSRGQRPGLELDAAGYAVISRLRSRYFIDWRGIQG